ncbi:MAG: sensor histidine kinase [Ktedonobacteraceae bacterium]
MVAIVSLAITVAMLIWAILNYQPIPIVYGPRAIYSLLLLSITLALLGRFLLLRLFKIEMTSTELLLKPNRLLTAWRPLFLLDITAPVYLAAGVLISLPAAVLTAIITQATIQGYTLLRGYVSWMEASYRLATTALLVFLSDVIYISVANPTHTSAVLNPANSHILETKEFLGSILAAGVMLILIILVSFPIIAQEHRYDLRVVWREYLGSPFLRFQLLVLSVGPLLPVVDIFDDASAELAWIFFLVPLFAIYYLALISAKLSMRTGELQHTLQDLSSTRRRRDELRDYASLITQVQEEERRRLARELHDDTAQALIALSLGLNGLERAMGRLNLPEKDVRWLSDLQNLADSTLEGVRRACRDLRPSVLDDLGLRAALEWLSDSSASRGVACTFTCIGTPVPTASEAEIAVFRIVQEALSNIWRHAHATKATIELHYRPQFLQITIGDDGQGFAFDQQEIVPDHQSQRGLGLLGMRERAMLIGAQLSITSRVGHGCTVCLSLPLNTKEKAMADIPVLRLGRNETF